MLAKRLSSLMSPAASLARMVSSAVLSNNSLASRGVLLVVVAGGAAGLGGCAQQPMSKKLAMQSKEYFPSSKYGAASPRVVALGERAPHGGGSYMVGKPYTIAGKTYYPSEKRFSGVGLASWYGEAFHGRRTANGEIYDIESISAAHPTMPLPCYARVTNLRNHRSLVVRVNDRGPFHENRIMDVSKRAAEALAFQGVGTARVKVEYLAPASLEGSDDEKLLATLREDGPATLDGSAPILASRVYEPTQTASLAPVAPRERVEVPAQEHVEPRAAAPQPPRPQKIAAIAAQDDDEDEAPRAKRVHGAAPRPQKAAATAAREDDEDEAPRAKRAQAGALGRKIAAIAAQDDEKSAPAKHVAGAPLPPTRPGRPAATGKRVDMAMRARQND